MVKKDIPAGVTAQSIVKNYIDAVGGEKALKAVKTILVSAKGTIQGQSLDMVSKISNKGMSTTNISMGGMSMMKQVIGDKSGYQTVQHLHEILVHTGGTAGHNGTSATTAGDHHQCSARPQQNIIEQEWELRTTPMLSPAMLIRFLDKYTAAMTAAKMASENNRNSSQAVLGHPAQRPFSRYALLPQDPHRIPT